MFLRPPSLELISSSSSLLSALFIFTSGCDEDIFTYPEGKIENLTDESKC